MNKPRDIALVAIVAALAVSMMGATTFVLDAYADHAHHGEIDILSVSHGVLIDEDSDSAEQSEVAEAEVENSLALAVEQGERPTLDRSHSITFGDGEHGKRPPTSSG